MKFAVVGAGAIGAYVGAALAASDADVTLIARGPQLEAIRKRGIQVLSPRGDFHVHPFASSDLATIGDADVIFLSTKAYSLPALAPDLSAAMKPGAAIVCAQNGIPYWYFQSHGGALEGTTLESVDPGGIISRSLPPHAAIGCVVYCATELIEPGIVRHVEGTRFPIAEPDGSRSERTLAIADAFRTAGLKAPVDPSLRDQIWLKLVGNVAFNPVTALTGATLGELAGLPDMVDLLRAMFDEAAAVARKLGIEFRVPLERRLEAGLRVGNHRTSMLVDRCNGKPLEHACMSGAVVELARMLDVPVPHIETVHACIGLVDTLNATRSER